MFQKKDAEVNNSIIHLFKFNRFYKKVNFTIPYNYKIKGC